MKPQKTKMNKATQEQISVAKKYRIPIAQAHTINMEKVVAYEKFKATPAEQLNDYLDKIGGVYAA